MTGHDILSGNVKVGYATNALITISTNAHIFMNELDIFDHLAIEEHQRMILKPAYKKAIVDMPHYWPKKW